MIPLHDDNPTRKLPVLTIVLIAVNVVIFLFWQPHGEREEEFLYRQAAIPCEVTTGDPIEVAGRRLSCQGETPVFPDKNVYLAVLTSMFLHANLLHIGGNMLFLWIFGNNIEDTAGRVAYLLFYLITGVAAAMAHILLFRDSTIPVVGASGAIAGVMGAYLVRFPRARVLTLIPIFFLFTVWIPAWVVLGVWFLGQFAINSAESGVATAAHIGGFVAGIALAFTVLPRRRHPAAIPPPGWFDSRD